MMLHPKLPKWLDRRVWLEVESQWGRWRDGLSAIHCGVEKRWESARFTVVVALFGFALYVSIIKGAHR